MSSLNDAFLFYWNVLATDLPELVPEFRFDKRRRWRFDFALATAKVAIELEGGVWTRGRHTRGSGFLNDISKYNAATEQGWRVLRYTAKDMENPQAMIDQIRNTLNYSLARPIET